MICADDTTKKIEADDQDKNLKYARPDRLCLDIAELLEPILLGRSPVRKHPRSKRFPMAIKSVLP